MAADSEIRIKDYEAFVGNLYEPWQKGNKFYNPITRMTSCSLTILSLIDEKRKNDAITLFEECKKLRVWNYNRDGDFDKISHPYGETREDALLRIEAISKESFDTVNKALEKAE